MFEADASCCSVLAAGVVTVVVGVATLAVLEFLLLLLLETGVEGASAGVLMPADEGEGLVTEAAGEAVGVAAIFCP